MATTFPFNQEGRTEQDQAEQSHFGSMAIPWMRIGFALLKSYEKLISRYSTHGNATFLPTGDFAWAGRVESGWSFIRAELDRILQSPERIPSFQQISKDQEALTQDDNWKTFFLYGYGFRMEENCRRCPDTDQLLRLIPGMKTAFFSILEPGKHLPHHRGPFKGVLRYHLGLRIPQPKEACGIRVGSDVRHWEEGRSMIFDDTHDHEAWNNSSERRVVLFVDFVRPLPFPLSWLNQLLIFLIGLSPFVQDARRNHKNWDAQIEVLINRAVSESSRPTP